jgi:thioredoxin 1
VLLTVQDDTFDELVLASRLPVLVDFWAPWCPPCGPYSKIVAELAEEFRGRLVMATLNTDDNPTSTIAHGVMAMPTVLVFRDREVVLSLVGARSKSALRKALEEVLASA